MPLQTARVERAVGRTDFQESFLLGQLRGLLHPEKENFERPGLQFVNSRANQLAQEQHGRCRALKHLQCSTRELRTLHVKPVLLHTCGRKGGKQRPAFLWRGSIQAPQFQFLIFRYHITTGGASEGL